MTDLINTIEKKNHFFRFSKNKFYILCIWQSVESDVTWNYCMNIENSLIYSRHTLSDTFLALKSCVTKRKCVTQGMSVRFRDIPWVTHISQSCVTKGKFNAIFPNWHTFPPKRVSLREKYIKFSRSDTILGVKECVIKGKFQTLMFKLFILSANEAYSWV